MLSCFLQPVETVTHRTRLAMFSLTPIVVEVLFRYLLVYWKMLSFLAYTKLSDLPVTIRFYVYWHSVIFRRSTGLVIAVKIGLFGYDLTSGYVYDFLPFGVNKRSKTSSGVSVDLSGYKVSY